MYFSLITTLFTSVDSLLSACILSFPFVLPIFQFSAIGFNDLFIVKSIEKLLFITGILITIFFEINRYFRILLLMTAKFVLIII